MMTEVTAPHDATTPRRRWWLRALRLVVAALLAAVILVVGGLSIVLLTFDPNQYKAALIQAMKEREQRTLVLPGTLELKLLPPLTLRTGPFVLSERDSDATFARADDLRLHLDVFALLRHRLVVDRVVMVRPQVHVVRDAQGRFNFADLLPGAQRGADPSRLALRLSVRRVQIDRGDILYDDDKAQYHGRFAALDAEIAGLDGNGRGVVRVQTAARFTQPALDTRLALRALLQADAAQHTFTLSNLALSAQGDALGATALQAQVNAAGAALTTRPAWSLQLHQAALQANGRADGDGLKLQATLPLLDLSADAVRIGALHATAELDTAQPLRLQFGSQPTAGTWSALRIAAAQLDVQRGTPGQPGAAQLVAASPLQCAAWPLECDLPALKLSGRIDGDAAAQTLALQGTAHYVAAATAGTQAQFDLRGRLAGSALQLGGALTRAAAAPAALTLNLDADRVDLDDWLPRAAGVKPQRAAGAAAQAWPLPALNVDARFTFASLTLKGTQWTAVQGQLHSDGRSVTLQPLSAQGFGGRVSTTLHADLAQQRYTLRQQATDVSVQPLWRALTGQDLLLGKAGWTLDLTAQGSTAQARLASLSGTARVEVKNGALKGLDLLQPLRNARALLAARRDRRLPLTAGEQTSFTLLRAGFTLHHGVAQNDDLLLQTPLLRVAGEGWFDLPAQRLDYVLLPVVSGALTGQGGAEFAAVRNLTVPLRIDGEFAKPVCTVLWSQAGKPGLRQLLQHSLQRQLPPPAASAALPPAAGLIKRWLP